MLLLGFLLKKLVVFFCLVVILPEFMGPYVCTNSGIEVPSGPFRGRLLPFERLLLEALLAVLGFFVCYILLNKYYV